MTTTNPPAPAPVTLQSIFDRVAAHLLKQNAPAVAAEGSRCLYHAADGKKCAVGVLIAAEHYSPDLEGKSLSQWMQHGEQMLGVLALSLGIPEDEVRPLLPLLEALQRVHDDGACDGCGRWPTDLELVANRFGLALPTWDVALATPGARTKVTYYLVGAFTAERAQVLANRACENDGLTSQSVIEAEYLGGTYDNYA